MRRVLFAGAGLVLVAVGLIGLFVPLMPTTIFIILAAGCFARSSPRLEAWLLDHRVLGPPLKAWRNYGAIPPRAKALAAVGLACGWIIFYLTALPGAALALGAAAALGLILAFIVTRPSGPRGGGVADPPRDRTEA
jgi:uncharacterized protein